MSNNTRVFHQTRGFAMKFSAVEKGIDACALAWVKVGFTFRDLTPEEAIAARNKQAMKSAPLPWAENPGLVFRVPDHMQAAQRDCRRLVMSANRLAETPKERRKRHVKAWVARFGHARRHATGDEVLILPGEGTVAVRKFGEQEVTYLEDLQAQQAREMRA